MTVKAYFAAHRRFWIGMGSALALIFAWEMALTYILPLNPFFFTKPTLIGAAFKEQILGTRVEPNFIGRGIL
jgi:RsiW-degrading membrane proteinase PrsW (M82 family)